MGNRVENELRKAASVLANAVRNKKCESVVFASASRREGTTTMVLRVANLLREREGLRPLVIEINREKPVYARLFHLDETRGFAAIAGGEACARKCVQPGPYGVPIIPAGKPQRPPAAGSDLATVLRGVLRDLEGQYEPVLVDAPALLEDPDALTVCTVIPRLVLVVRAANVSSEVLRQVKQEIQQNVEEFTLVGTILNRHRRYIPGWIYEWLLR